MITEIYQHLLTFFGPMGSPAWWVLGAMVVTVFLARWARAIRTLLPFIGAGTVIALILWILVNVGVISVHIT
jgi:hypothetical protein